MMITSTSTLCKFAITFTVVTTLLIIECCTAFQIAAAPVQREWGTIHTGMLIRKPWHSINLLVSNKRHDINQRKASVISMEARRSMNEGDRSESGSKITKKRRQQLGIPDSDDEYDLEMALNTNTDPLITKVIAGSFILAVMALLIVGVVVPSITDFGEGVCSPIQNGGRC